MFDHQKNVIFLRQYIKVFTFEFDMHSSFPKFLPAEDITFLEGLPIKNIDQEYRISHIISENMIQGKCVFDNSSIIIKSIPLPLNPTCLEKDQCIIFIASLRSTYSILLRPPSHSSSFVCYKDLFLTDGDPCRICLVYNLVAGKDLIDWTDGNLVDEYDEIDVQEYVNITYALLANTHILHSLGIIHRGTLNLRISSMFRIDPLVKESK